MAHKGVGNAVGVVLVFAVIGPLIGLVVFSLGVGLLARASGTPDGLMLSAFFLIYGAVFAHYVGLPWACLAGAVASVIALRLGRNPAWIGPASGALSFAGAALAGAVRLPLPSDAPTGAPVDDLGTGIFAVMAVVHIASAAAAWMLARGLVQPAGPIR